MKLEIAETALTRPVAETAPSSSASEPDDRQAVDGRAEAGSGKRQDRLRALRADPARMLALRESSRALWGSRLLIWAAAVGTLLLLGNGPIRNAFNPAGVTSGFGRVGDLLAAPAARWDAAWYLYIAQHGYSSAGALVAQRAAFFPLYPLGVRGLTELAIPPVIAGVLLSLAAFGLALYGIHRLTTLELAGRPAASPRERDGSRGKGEAGGGGLSVGGVAVMVTAFAPMAFFFSAVYSESLYLALSVGVFWSARNGRWALVGLLGALAGATRSTGVVLLLPALMIYLYGPREDRPPELRLHPPGLPALVAAVRPRYRPRRDLLWLGLMPVGVLAFMGYMVLSGGSALTPFHVQEIWSRHFAGPYVGIWTGAVAAFDGARQLLSGQSAHHYFALAGGSPTIAAGHDLMLFAFLLLSIPMVVGVLRRLPLAYGLYVLAALALPLSYPVTQEPLMSLPRFLVVLFPFSIWLGGYLVERPRMRIAALVLSGLGMCFFVAQFATWHWVA